MKITGYTILVFCSLAFRSNAQTADQVFQKTYETLNRYATLSYKYERKIDYVSENYKSETSGITYLDYSTGDTAIGFRYQALSKGYQSVYNGSETFYMEDQDSSIMISFKAQKGHMESLPLFANSLVTLRKALPLIIADKQMVKYVGDTLVNNKPCYAAVFVLPNKTLGYLGGYKPITLKRDFYYKVVVDKKSWLPLMVVQTNSAEPQDKVVTIFTEVSADISSLPEEAWYFSTYLKDHKPKTNKKTELIRTGLLAPEWKASFAESGDALALADLKGKLVLMEFWIKNCGYCISAVPELNALAKQFQWSDLVVVGLNGHDQPTDIEFFYQKNGPAYRTLMDPSGSIAKAYGVDGYPTVVLVDKTGKVVYAGSVDRTRLEQEINKALRKQ